MKRMKAKVALLAIIFLLPASSWSVSSPKVIEGAKKEGRLVYWTSMNLNQSKLVVSRFQKRYPFIETQIFRASGGPLLKKVLREDRAGNHPWDVLAGRGDLVPSLQKRRLLAPYRSPEAARIPREFKDKRGYWTAYYATLFALGYNTQSVKKDEVPKTYEDLLHPRWNGKKISIDTDAFGLLVGLIKAWGKEKALAYLKKIAAQEPIFNRGNTFRIQLAIAGEFPLVIAYGTTIQRFTSRGAPIDWVPLEPVPVQMNPVMLGAKARHPNAAKLFIDFLLSEEGQRMLAKFRRIPVRQGIQPNPPRLFNGYKRIVMNPKGYANFSQTKKLYRDIFNLN